MCRCSIVARESARSAIRTAMPCALPSSTSIPSARAAVTDADLVAGRLVASNFLGGRMRLYPARAIKAIGAIASAMKTGAMEAARGVIRVVNANMERAIRVITVERGYDPREFT